MAKILLSAEVKRVQNELRRLSTLLRRINEFKITLKIEGTDKEQNIAKFLQDNIDLLGSYSVDDVANNLDTNKSVIANLSIVAENVQSLINREKNYANIDLTNVVVDIANLGKFFKVGAGGVIEYATGGVNGQDGADGKDGTDGADGQPGKDGTDGADGKDGTDSVVPGPPGPEGPGSVWNTIIDLWTNPNKLNKYKDAQLRIVITSSVTMTDGDFIEFNQLQTFSGVTQFTVKAYNGPTEVQFYIDQDRPDKIFYLDSNTEYTIDDTFRVEIR